MRGRAFGFVAILCATWVAARVGFVLIAEQQRRVGKDHVVAAKTRSDMFPKSGPAKHTPAGTKTQIYSSANVILLLRPRRARLQSVPMHPHPFYLKRTPTDTETQKDDYPADLAPFEASASVELPKNIKAPRPIQFYAYSFWRRGNSAPGVFGNGQYGGSQSALLMTIPMLRFQDKSSGPRLAFTARVSVSHNIPREGEVATGLQWRPSATFPAQVTLERRFRPDRADAFAAFVSGGHDAAALPLGFALDGYGQAGILTGKSGGVFANAQLHALKPVTSRTHIKLAAGAGAWVGGQSEIMRLDIGPSVRADLHAEPAILRIDASWRYRIAGNAEPGNGPAVTLSTSF